ncbi:excinuclease ABC subunit UvrA [Myxococcota bacterium]|nr:excinuclease ABC subunit UvrA [Myxococcota bacterium]
MPPEVIEITGARQHNLRVGQLNVPKNRFVVFTGVSGSGKSSMAFDTIYAEGQRRYVESLSSYARQFLGQLEKPAYDRIRGLTPTIAIEQKSASSNPRSTVGTVTEIHDYLRVLYARVGVQHCPVCDRVVEAMPTSVMVRELAAWSGTTLLLAPLVEQRKGTFIELFEDLSSRGFARVRVDGRIVTLESGLSLAKTKKHTIELVVDRITPAMVESARIADSVETALREGGGVLIAEPVETPELSKRFSTRRSCTACGLGLPELSPQAFSFNGPLGMCQACHGLGRAMEMDPARVVPDTTLSVRQGAIEPWAATMERGEGWTYRIFEALEQHYGINFDAPYETLPARHREILLQGNRGEKLTVDIEHKRGSGTYALDFEGVLNTLMRRYSETQSQAMRDYYQKYLSESACRECGGSRLRPESRAVRVAGRTIVEVCADTVGQSLRHFEGLILDSERAHIAHEVVREVQARLRFLDSVGLGYLTLDRLAPSLSGGEAQRIRLASQLGSELSGVTYVLDEPSIGLHARDNDRLIRTLGALRDNGNTVLVVEHDAETMRAADHVVDFGPGAGRLGGQVTFEGPPSALLRSDTLTGQYLSGRLKVAEPGVRRPPKGWLVVRGAREHNLKSIDVAFPLGCLTAVTGVSGAGKSSLVRGTLHPALAAALHRSREPVGDHDGLDGLDRLDKVIHIDQTPIGRTPRSNPATYTKAFDQIRDLFAQLPASRVAGYNGGRFSFNVAGGRCEACHGDGVRRIEMHFLPDVYVTCETCGGRRYNDATLRVKYRGLDISQVLELSVDRALEVFGNHPPLRRILQTLSDVGLGYVHLGQPAPTLSGGEAQRVKLSRELAREDTGRTLYILDEPTTGLHFDDIRRLLGVLQRLVDAGNTIVVVEHNLDVIGCADHVIDLGPEGGDGGGFLVAEGTPEAVARVQDSFTGQCLAQVFV